MVGLGQDLRGLMIFCDVSRSASWLFTSGTASFVDMFVYLGWGLEIAV